MDDLASRERQDEYLGSPLFASREDEEQDEWEDRADWAIHQPECHDAPIPGRQWYSACEPGGDYDSELGWTGTGPRVDPATGRCEGCGETACRTCGRENCPDHEAQS